MTWRALGICPRCFGLRGRFGEGLVQRCSCEPWPGERWPRSDFNQAWELCRCCGLEVLPSGSRWSVWFCSGCKARVSALNTSVGRCVIPIGRHSLMNGVGLAGDDVPQPAAVDRFVDRFVDVMTTIVASEQWATAAVRYNISALGLTIPTDADISLVRYVNALQEVAVDKRAAFGRLVELVRRDALPLVV